jgi:MFS family permease
MGLEADALNNNDTSYSLGLALFYVAYIIFSVPGTLLTKYLLPNQALALGTFIWSIACSCTAAAQNPAGVYAARFFVGVGEAIFGQGVSLAVSYWYTKPELSKRIGIFVSAGSLAGAFGGLIAFGGRWHQ